MTANNVFSIKQAKYPKPSKLKPMKNLNDFSNLDVKDHDDKIEPEAMLMKPENRPELVCVGYVDQDGNYYNMKQYKLLLTKAGLQPVFKINVSTQTGSKEMILL